MANDTAHIILQTARRHFVQNGYAATRLQDIADEAGINKAMLHYYFRTKEKLYYEIVRQTLDQIIPRFATAIASEGSFEERLEKLVDSYISTLIEQPDIPFFIMSELSQKRERFVDELQKRAAFFPAAQGFIQQMMMEMEAGRIRRINPLQLFLNIMGLTVFPFIARPIFTTVFQVSGPEFEQMMNERKTMILDFIHHALRVEG